MVVVALAQILMAFNVNALRVSIGGIVASFDTSPTTVGTAIVTHSLYRRVCHARRQIGRTLGSAASF